MNLLFERVYPWLAGAISTIIFCFFIKNQPIPPKICELLSAIITISAIAVGFLATAKSILLGLSEKRVIEQIKQLNLYHHLINYIIWAIHFCFFLAVISAMGLMIDFSKPIFWHKLFFIFWFFWSSTSLFMCYRVINILGKILKAD